MSGLRAPTPPALMIAAALASMLCVAPPRAVAEPAASGPIVNPVEPIEIEAGPFESGAGIAASAADPAIDAPNTLNSDTKSTVGSPDPGGPPQPATGTDTDRAGVDASASSGESVKPSVVEAEPPAQELLPLGKAAPSMQRSGAATAGAADRGGGGWIKQTGAALGVVIGLIILGRFGLIALARRTGGLAAMLGAGGRAPSGVMEILARYPVSRGHTLVLLKVDRRVLVLCHTSNGFTTLTEFIEPEEVASILMRVRDDEGESMAARFNDLLQQMSDSPDPEEDGPVSPRMVLSPNAGRSLADWPPAGRAGAAGGGS